MTLKRAIQLTLGGTVGDATLMHTVWRLEVPEKFSVCSFQDCSCGDYSQFYSLAPTV